MSSSSSQERTTFVGLSNDDYKSTGANFVEIEPRIDDWPSSAGANFVVEREILRCRPLGLLNTRLIIRLQDFGPAGLSQFLVWLYSKKILLFHIFLLNGIRSEVNCEERVCLESFVDMLSSSMEASFCRMSPWWLSKGSRVRTFVRERGILNAPRWGLITAYNLRATKIPARWAIQFWLEVLSKKYCRSYIFWILNG